jgi:hypothetical protein
MSVLQNHYGHVPVLLGAVLGVLWSGNASRDVAPGWLAVGWRLPRRGGLPLHDEELPGAVVAEVRSVLAAADVVGSDPVVVTESGPSQGDIQIDSA